MHRNGIWVLPAMLMPLAGQAHHSFAPHFYPDRTVSITGTITEFEARNPHAYLHIASIDENGRSQEYVCESAGISTLERNGIGRDLFVVGETIRVDGAPARRDPYMCFFRTIHLADGRIFDTSGGDRVAAGERPRRDSIYGTWLIIPAGRNTSGPWEMINHLSPAGERAVAAYDPFTDDPVLRCSSVGIRRVWSAPSEPLNISRDGERIVIHHEWMDTVRVVHLDLAEHPPDVEPSTMGHSIGHWEGDTLIVETGKFSAGVLRQYVEEPGQPTRGLLHSDQLTIVERIRFDKESQTLNVVIQQSDPLFFTREFDPISIDYAPSDAEITHFGCVPEV